MFSESALNSTEEHQIAETALFSADYLGLKAERKMMIRISR